MSVASAFKAAWEDVCCPAYQKGEINNECTLHAMLYAELRARLPRPKYLVLCEPQLDNAVPDIVVLDTADQTIVGIGELKLDRYPKFKGDLEKLARLARSEAKFPLLLDPAQMQFHSNFGVSPNCVLAFGVIGADDSEAVDERTLLSKMDEHGVRADRFVPLIHKAWATSKTAS